MAKVTPALMVNLVISLNLMVNETITHYQQMHHISCSLVHHACAMAPNRLVDVDCKEDAEQFHFKRYYHCSSSEPLMESFTRVVHRLTSYQKVIITSTGQKGLTVCDA